LKTLLQKIQTELRSGVTAVRDRDVVLIPHPEILPESIRFPAIGIKDGKIKRTDLLGGCVEKNMPITVFPFVRMLKDEEPIIALLTIADAITTALADNLLDAYVREVSVGDEDQIWPVKFMSGYVITKPMFFEYVKED